TIESMLVLASRSPRRQEILATAGIPFSVRPADIDETALFGEPPRDHVLRLAREKAAAVQARPGEIVLGADTVVVVEGEILGKPTDSTDATRMLGLLSGRVHEVLTGVCLRSERGLICDAETTRVRFVPLTPEDIDAYVGSGEPMDKAGAYAIQGLAGKFIDRIEGCYFNVVGLPVALVWRRLQELSPDRGS
ncbi:MAG TPA: Maf family protein, partial [Bryobacteraceae bacterium]|nr:Maf family protein [Bryobacteraceae bacterium]